MSGHGLQPIAAQHSDCVQHVISPDAVESPHPVLQTQKQRLENKTKTYFFYFGSYLKYYSKRSEDNSEDVYFTVVQSPVLHKSATTEQLFR